MKEIWDSMRTCCFETHKKYRIGKKNARKFRLLATLTEFLIPETYGIIDLERRKLYVKK